MQTAADRDFTMGMALLLAARRNEQVVADQDSNGALQRLAQAYRERGTALMQGVGAQHARN